MRVALRPAGSGDRIEFGVQTDNDVDRVLWYETVLGTPPARPDRLDAAAVALAPRAMHGGQDLHIDGPVSWSVLAGIEEYVDAWTSWLPALYKPFRLHAEEVVDDRGDGAGPHAGAGVIAWSGGVDSTYALVANDHAERGPRKVDLVAAVQIHGFDIALDDRAAFDRSLTGTAPLLAARGIEHVAVRTNWHDEMCPDWEMSFFAGFASLLHLFADRASTALMAPDNPYQHPRLVWGSNPITNRMLASRRFRFAAPGSATLRVEKCRAIGAIPEVRSHLRVCWQGDHRGANCGRCEKCVRTKLAFVVAGHGTLPALGPITADDLATAQVRSHTMLDGYERMSVMLRDIDPHLADEVGKLVVRERRRLDLASAV